VGVIRQVGELTTVSAELPRLRRWFGLPASFWLASLAVLVTIAVFLCWTLVSLGGAKLTTAFDDIGEMIAALIAAVACGWAAAAATGRVRRRLDPDGAGRRVVGGG